MSCSAFSAGIAHSLNLNTHCQLGAPSWVFISPQSPTYTHCQVPTVACDINTALSQAPYEPSDFCSYVYSVLKLALEIHPFIHPFNKYLLSTYYMSGTTLSTGDATVNKT